MPYKSYSNYDRKVMNVYTVNHSMDFYYVIIINIQFNSNIIHSLYHSLTTTHLRGTYVYCGVAKRILSHKNEH